ncbi:MAG: hypothetical protein ACE5FT_06955 [Candidatus Nanoarchaeia archaeon]
MSSNITKTLSILLVLLLIANMVLFGLGRVPMWSFWLTIGVIWLFTKYVIPKIKN